MNTNKVKLKKGKSVKKRRKAFKVINPNAAGIDIGSTHHYAAVPEDRDENPVRCFECFTSDLHKLADWLEECQIKTVAMESTGVYWIPVFQILVERGFDVKLVNARHVKNVSGRKTDVKDCQWLQQLHTYGLLTGSFRPDDAICILRSYVRQRDNLIQSASQHIQRMQKALTQMNIQLHKVLSDITGATGMKIVKAIIAGERNALILVKMRDPYVKNSEERFVKALEGDYRKEHIFSLKQELELYEIYKQKIFQCDKQIEKHLSTFESVKTEIPKLKKTRKKRNDYVPHFDLKTHLYRITGVDLTKIEGIEAPLAQKIISEIGLDMSKWETEKHFASWLGLCPNNKITGNKIKSRKSLKVVNRAATAFRLAARSAGSSKSALAGFYRRIKYRRDPPTAITATAHKIAKIFYRMLKYRMDYKELDLDYYEKKYKERMLKNLRKKANRFGYNLVLNSIPENDKTIISNVKN